MTIYMYSEYLPLPKPGEVLCSHQGTTCEEISLLWRRAINDPEQRRIFILVCEHNLPYNIVKEAINELRNQIQGKSGMGCKAIMHINFLCLCAVYITILCILSVCSLY
jgi:hypothetical protein